MEQVSYDSIREKSLKSVKWTYSVVILPQIVSAIVTVSLAALLGPSVFGLIAIASLIISFVDIVKDNALTRAFIQSEGDEVTLFNQTFWLSLGYGVCFYLLVLISAPLISDLFHSKESIAVIRIMGLQIVLSSLCTGHNGILIRGIDFKKRFKIDILPTITPMLVAIPLAYGGMGVWSLVIGYLSSAFVRTIVVWHFVPIRPRLSLDKEGLKKIALFGFFCSLEALLAWFFMWGDRAIVGHYVNVRLLGLYTFASTVVATVLSTALAPLINMSYPVFCRIKDDMSQFFDTVCGLLQIAALLTFPIGVLLCVSACIVPALIGQKWAGIQTPLAILAVAESLTWTVNFIISDAVRAKGRADIMPKFQVMRLLYTLPVLIVGAKWGGLEGFCYAKLANSVVTFFFFILLLKVVVKVRLGLVFNLLKTPFLSAVVMAVCLYLGTVFFNLYGLTGIGFTCILAFVGLLIYLGSLEISNPMLLRSLFKNIARAL